MNFPNKEIVEKVRAEYPIGTRVELLKMNDVQAPPVGTKGTVRGVDDTASLLVDWDNGCGLNVIHCEDIVIKIQKYTAQIYTIYCIKDCVYYFSKLLDISSKKSEYVCTEREIHTITEDKNERKDIKTNRGNEKADNRC